MDRYFASSLIFDNDNEDRDIHFLQSTMGEMVYVRSHGRADGRWWISEMGGCLGVVRYEHNAMDLNCERGALGQHSVREDTSVL